MCDEIVCKWQFYNIGSGNRTTLKELVEKILKISESDLPIRYEKRNQATLVTNRIGATGKALKDLGFSASISLEEGIRKLIEWRASDLIKSQSGWLVISYKKGTWWKNIYAKFQLLHQPWGRKK